MPAPTQARPWRNWYNLAAWKRRRAYQLACQPLCVECKRNGIDTPANTADHITPHRGDWEGFIAGDLQSLCAACHASVKQRQEEFERRDRLLGPAESSRPI